MYYRVLYPAILETLCNFNIIKITISSMEIIATTIMVMIIDTLITIIIVIILFIIIIIIIIIIEDISLTS